MVEIDFNNKNILKGHLDQAILQSDYLKDIENRIVIGSLEGGLGYKIFGYFIDFTRNLPEKFRHDTIELIHRYNDYLKNLEEYISCAEVNAKDYNFKLLVDGGERLIEISQNSSIYSLVIGSENIKDFDMFKNFLEMVETCTPNLNNKYKELIKYAKAIHNPNQ